MNKLQRFQNFAKVLPEFATHHLYDDFTLPTIDGEHDFLLGGSWASLGGAGVPPALRIRITKSSIKPWRRFAIGEAQKNIDLIDDIPRRV